MLQSLNWVGVWAPKKEPQTVFTIVLNYKPKLAAPTEYQAPPTQYQTTWASSETYTRDGGGGAEKSAGKVFKGGGGSKVNPKCQKSTINTKFWQPVGQNPPPADALVRHELM